jgi:hypothetical protein
VVWEVLLDQLVFRLSPYEYVFHLVRSSRQPSSTPRLRGFGKPPPRKQLVSGPAVREVTKSLADQGP